MENNIFEKMTDEELAFVWAYMIFNKDEIIEKTEKWAKEAAKAGMTLTEYLESISQLNNKGKLSFWWKCDRCGKMIPYMADFCHECTDELLGEPPKPFKPQAESEETICR